MSPQKPLSDAAGARRGPGRPACERARCAVLKATRGLLRESTYEALSVDGIAKRSRVPKSTIYRHWPSKAALAVTAFLDLVAERVDVADGGDLKAAVEAQLLGLCGLYRSEVGVFLRSVIAAAQSDPEVRDALWDGFIARRRRLTAELIGRAKARGEVAAGCEPETLMDLLYGPVVYRLLLTGRAPSDREVRRQVELVFRGARRV